MKRFTILLGAFLSIFILVLIPSINSVNANIQNENNLNTMSINIDDIKTIRNRLLNSDCNCQKTADTINIEPKEWELLCEALFLLIWALIIIMVNAFDFTGDLLDYLIGLTFGPPILSLMFIGEKIFDCDWYFASLSKLFINNEQFLYNLIKFSYLELGEIYEK